MDPTAMDALLSMMDLDELHEALEMVDALAESGQLAPDEAVRWRVRITEWSREASSA